MAVTRTSGGEHPSWSQKFMKNWVLKSKLKGSLPRDYLDSVELLVTDHRMYVFWQWLATCKFQRCPSMKRGLTVCGAIIRSRNLPGKPGNMSPAERKSYFSKIRKHASALATLLSGTRFEQSRTGHPITSPDTQEISDFPTTTFLEAIHELLEWTSWEDKWDGGEFSSSAPIVQANASGVQVNYFSCKVYEWFATCGERIPFPILATLANVALQLGGEQQVDEETVRKQVNRYIQRQIEDMS